MNNYKNLIIKNDLKVNKVTIKGNITIISTPLGQFVLYEYLDEIKYDNNEKARDYIKLLALLHNKTSYFMEDDYNKIYDDIKTKLLDLNKYYNYMIDNMDKKEYLSPNEYLLTRNISLILSSINYCLNELDIIKELTLNKKRVVTNYNNDLNTMIKTIDNMYLTSLDNVIVDSPIIDLLNFYNSYYDELDFESLFLYYEKIFPLLEEEKILLSILISMPDKIIVTNSIENISDIKKSIDKLNKSLDILNSKKEKETSTHKSKDNK